MQTEGGGRGGGGGGVKTQFTEVPVANLWSSGQPLEKWTSQKEVGKGNSDGFVVRKEGTSREWWMFGHFSFRRWRQYVHEHQFNQNTSKKKHL